MKLTLSSAGHAVRQFRRKMIGRHILFLSLILCTLHPHIRRVYVYVYVTSPIKSDLIPDEPHFRVLYEIGCSSIDALPTIMYSNDKIISLLI